ncbi:DUF3179 domain-containing (seleno)protein [Rubrimonas cliftonensis]|uniref:DUF3179 domain-containing protein n=1 Tax=Rubrimonas cliftonensis TaxID=89524 RepID=A0A1H4GIJ0_9RHOB|nr:DUF3179 domain-containing (seleno)protein [Rubrimonas cliftonensis]SEB09443.1 Protein of unknown function [Rubrimonas cliftonensis]
MSRTSDFLALLAALAIGAHAVPVDAEEPGLSEYVIEQFGRPPAIPDGPLSEAVRAAVATAFVESVTERRWDGDQIEALDMVSGSGDPRLAWIIADLMRFISSPALSETLSDAAAKLLAIAPPAQNRWGAITDHLIAWDVPAPPGYLAIKRAIFTGMVPGWEAVFVEGDIDWRHVSWGGVLIDDRPYGRTDEPCNCIPAADNPEVEAAEDATWLADDAVIFGLSINGEHRAYPRRIMEVREMVNDTLGGRDLGIPYCTLCGAAQAWFTDDLPAGVERPVLRTSGLLIRSNKVMYDVVTGSVFDTFLGKAVTGPLAEIGFALEQASVVTTTWGDWKAAHPDTTVLVEALALGRDFDFRSGRDADGPIFPVGDVDPRLPVHEDVVGVVSPAGVPVAFQRSAAMAALTRGEEVTLEGVRLVLDAGGLRAVAMDGDELGSHQAFWFAWSQFHPGSTLWPR